MSESDVGRLLSRLFFLRLPGKQKTAILRRRKCLPPFTWGRPLFSEIPSGRREEEAEQTARRQRKASGKWEVGALSSEECGGNKPPFRLLLIKILFFSPLWRAKNPLVRPLTPGEERQKRKEKGGGEGRTE